MEDTESVLWDKAKAYIEWLKTLEKDWGGSQEEPPTEALVDSAVALATIFKINGLTAPDSVYPGPDGVICMEFHVCDQDETIYFLELERPGSGSWMITKRADIGAKPSFVEISW